VRNFVKLIGSILVCLGIGIAGSFFTVKAIPTWYEGLIKPSFAPPNWLFAPVWTALYILMGISFYLVLKKGTRASKNRDALFIFGIQLALNAIWSPIFFGLKNVPLAMLVIITLWYYIALTIKGFKKINPLASYLLYPYLLWVTFASILNFSIWMLNV
jgi:tryptophan-rich sensory protein